MTYEGNPDGKHYWLTPKDLYDQLQAEFAFDFDPCPYPLPDGFDGLTAEWGSSNYVNPPFKGPTAWVRKAIEENKKGGPPDAGSWREGSKSARRQVVLDRGR